MSMDEAQARRVVLAQAIETADTQGKLLGPEARASIDRQARQAARAHAGARGARLEAVLVQRAADVVQAAEAAQPWTGALAKPHGWQHWLAVGLPVATLLAGAFTDRISDPHRVDLLSQPLLAIVAWNLVAYAVLLLRWLMALWRDRRGRPSPSPSPSPSPGLPARLQRWVDGLGRRQRSGHLRAEVTALFNLHWQAASAGIGQQRLARVLHLAAAGWAAGVALSLLARGLVVQYRVGWESTWLSAEQVHAVLGILFLPAVALFGFAPLSLQEVAALQVEAGGGHAPERRWVLMVAALLLLVVVLPRLALAAWAWWRERRLARAVELDLQQPYFQQLAAHLLPAQIRLGLAPQEGEDAMALRRLLLQQPRPGPEWLIETGEGDTLALADAPFPSQPRTLGPQARDPHAPDPSVDLWLQLRRDSTDGEAAVLPDAGAPVVVLDAVPPAWVQERQLWEAVRAALPAALQPGMGRLAAAWEARNRLRLGQSMSSLALQLLEAAREVREVRSTPVSVKQLLVPSDRQAHGQAQQAAMEQVARQLAQSAAVTRARLAQLHGLDPGAAVPDGPIAPRDHFLLQHNVSTPQAGMAGATTGAAMGASVDLLTGGLTLGAAAALGALVGGSAALAAAAWKNKSGANATAQVTGLSAVQAGDAMLQALTEAGLLHYLAVIHAGRQPDPDGAQALERWTAEVAAVADAHRAALQAFWASTRARTEGPGAGTALAAQLEAMALELLGRLYPDRLGDR